MARRSKQLRSSGPPALAQALVGWLALPGDRETVLGDLAEEYALINRDAVGRANRWYWSQTVRSCPPMALRRIQADRGKGIAVIMAVTTVALLAIWLWDLYVARYVAQTLATQSQPPGLWAIRALYFLVQTLGVAMIGALVARIAFTAQRSFALNSMVVIGPIAIALVVLFAVTLFGRDGPPLTAYFLFQLCLSLPALLGGALFMARARGID